MKLETHIAFGLFIGSLMYYFFGFGANLILLMGFAAFIPDIDWAMQFKWGMGNRHRTFGHNIWFVLIVSLIGFYLTRSLLVFISIVLGMLTHLIADSFTVTGVSWLYPYGYEKKFYFKGKLNMSDPSETKFERYLTIALLTFSGLLFLMKGVALDLTSPQNYIALIIIAYVGYRVFKNFSKIIKSFIRKAKI